MYAAAAKRAVLLTAAFLLIPAALALGPPGTEANVISSFMDTAWSRMSEAAGNPFWYGIGLALAIILFAAIAHLPPEGFAVAAVVGVLIVATVIPILSLVAAFIFGILIALALLKLFASR